MRGEGNISSTLSFNTFSVTTFEKTVLLQVRMTGAMNMALRLDVKHKIV